MKICKNIYNIIKKVLSKIKYKTEYLFATRSSDSYINYLRKRGIKIGTETCFFEPRTVCIDTSRPNLLEIGNHVFIHGGITILTHDWASWCFVYSDAEFFPSHAKVTIGDNVWFGRNVTVCKGVTIGDNCIIGIGSIVTSSIPSGSVAVGIPARVICSYEDYIEKRRKEYVSETIEYAKELIKSGNQPAPEDFYDDYPAFVDGDNYKDYDYPYYRIFSKERFELWKKTHKKIFNGFDDFMKKVKNN